MPAPSQGNIFIRIADWLFSLIFWILSTRAVSAFAGSLARSESRWLKNVAIWSYVKGLRKTNMADMVEKRALEHRTFEQFFIRQVDMNLRPMPENDDAIACPVDGAVSAFGTIEDDTLLQVKGHTFSLSELVGADEARRFEGGRYATLYLSPTDYHRIHMPCDATARKVRYTPGRLFPVIPSVVRAVSKIYNRNERATVFFDTDRGPMAMSMIGAMFVGGIHTRWTGLVCPPHERAIKDHAVAADRGRAQRGDEASYFTIGSTVVLLFGRDMAEWDADLAVEQRIRVGMPIGRLSDAQSASRPIEREHPAHGVRPEQQGQKPVHA